MGLFNLFHTPEQRHGLNIIIVGCGTVGATLVERLSKEGHDITIIDKDRARVNEIANYYDVMGIIGNGARYGILMDAGIQQADVFIAVAEDDELNLLCCSVASKVSKCATFARVHTPDYSSEAQYFREKLGLTMIINPELSTAMETARLLYQPNALEVNPFAHGRAEMVKFEVYDDNPLVGKTIAEIGSELPHDLLITVIERDDEVIIPKGFDHIEVGDQVSFVSSKEHVRDFFEYIGFDSRQVSDCMIIGGGTSAYYLANQLIDMGIEVKIIEQNRARCEELSILLPKAIIIHGDGTSEELLHEENIRHVESFIPLTGVDEENILLALHAMNVNDDVKVVTKINRVNYRDVIRGMDLGSVIYPRYIIAEAIISYVRGLMNSKGSNVETLYHMFNDRVEAVEFTITEDSPITEVYLKDLKIRKNVLIATINRKGSIKIPSGRDRIHVGDSVMIVTTNLGYDNINQILEK
ncbi:MAG: Trk system potassium transporter TrkA [Eubacterium sp.]|nr:Trk system potassium transporter TrkA [Eubacterium sp.]